MSHPDLRDLYTPAAIANGLAAGVCVVTAVVADRPWFAVVGTASALAALVLLVLAGEWSQWSRCRRWWIASTGSASARYRSVGSRTRSGSGGPSRSANGSMR
jgi:hypothetical protein